MNKKNTVPRVIRTRNLIIDSFIKLSKQKDFKNISITDITNEAVVNRSTFYYHFTDKYDLLEQTLKYKIMHEIINKLSKIKNINDDTIIEIFMSITEFFNSLLNQCPASYSSLQKLLETSFKKELQDLFNNILSQQSKKNDPASLDHLRIYSTLLAWSIYGAVIDWQVIRIPSSEEYAKKIVPYIFNGINSLVTPS